MTKKENIIKLLTTNNCDAILLHSSENRFWYSNFASSMGYIIATKLKTYLILDGRYLTAAQNQTSLTNVDEIVYFGTNVWQTMNEILLNNDVKTLSFEADWIVYQQFQQFHERFSNQKLIPINCEAIRMIKETWEVAKITKACDITNLVFEDVLNTVKVGMTEKELARFVSDAFLKHGADKLSFETIVASGINGSMPHAVPTNKAIQANELVTLDMGCYVDGYCSDQTRTFAMGQVSEKLLDIYQTVFDAQSLGLSLVKDGANAGDIHRQVDAFITSKGYKGYFNHGLGHGLGIQIHEEPYENATSQTILKTGMTITIEPGIYIPNLGGVRIEDDVVVTKDGYQLLTSSSRHLQIIK